MIFAGSLAILQLLLRSFDTWFSLIERTAVGLEAVLPLPQLLLNYSRHSLSGFRFTLLFAWVSGDFVKTLFYYIDGQAYYYQIGGTCQTLLDVGIFAQYVYYWRKKRLEAKRLAALDLAVEELSLNDASISSDETSALLSNEAPIPRASIEQQHPHQGQAAAKLSAEKRASVDTPATSDSDQASVSSAGRSKAAEVMV